jgi:hypothetical protein
MNQQIKSIICGGIIVATRRRLRKRVERDVQAAWPAVRRIFGLSGTVYLGRVGPSASYPFQAELLHRLITQGSTAERLFEQGLASSNPMICAYCLAGLKMLNSRVLTQLPPRLLNRREMVLWAGGCLGIREALGETAKHYRDEARTGRRMSGANRAD